jgi:hypothetical protein
MNPPTPWPPDVPAGKNPPDGAIIDYYLGQNSSGPVTLEIVDSAGKLVRRFASTDPVPEVPANYPVPLYWLRPPQVLSDAPGQHRFLWDLHYTPAPGSRSLPDEDQAVPHNTPPPFTSPWVMPGNYTVKLTANGQTLTQPMTVTMDPRVKTPLADLQAQFRLSKELYDAILETGGAMEQITAMQKQLKERAANGPANDALTEYGKRLDALAGVGYDPFADRFGGRRTPAGSFVAIRGQLDRLLHELQNADVAPTAQQSEAVATRMHDFAGLKAQWEKLRSQGLASLNLQLKPANPTQVALQ